MGKLKQKIIALSAKIVRIKRKDNGVIVEKEFPMDSQHAKEIEELQKKGLVKVNFQGTGTGGIDVIVHKNVTNKISYDFIVKKYMISEFVNRNEEKPSKCQLYRENFLMPQTYLTMQQYSQEVVHEDRELEKFTKLYIESPTPKTC